MNRVALLERVENSDRKQVGEGSVILETVAGRLNAIICGIKQMMVGRPRRNEADMFQLTRRNEPRAAAFRTCPTYGIITKS